MKFATTFAIFSAAATTAVVGAQPAAETNGQRMARGLPPLPPSRRWQPTSAAGARRTTPSATPPSNQCNTGAIQCCNSVQKANDPATGLLLSLLGIVGLNPSTQVGVQCSPLSAVGLGGNSCTQQPVCCTNNKFNGVVAIGCTPININL